MQRPHAQHVCMTLRIDRSANESFGFDLCTSKALCVSEVAAPLAGAIHCGIQCREVHMWSHEDDRQL